MKKGNKPLFVGLAILLAFLPIHTLVTVWLTKEFGHLYVWSSWKEVLLLFTTGLSTAFVIADSKLRQSLASKSYNKFAVAYGVLLTVYLLLGQRDRESLVSFIFHGRFIMAFIVAQVVAWYVPNSYKIWTQIIVITGIISAIFGLLQTTLLPADFLVRFGYDPIGTNTPGIPPAIHQTAPQSHVYRAQAALRGPNVLGAYLVLPIVLLAERMKKNSTKPIIVLVVILVACLYFTYSRSALLGLIGAGLLAVLFYSRPAVRKTFLLLGVTMGVLGVIATVAFRNTKFVQSVILHRNADISTTQSNEGHIELTRLAVIDVAKHPLGHGLGTAGPASALDGQSKIAENYFLQVGQEAGWLALALIVVFHGFVAMALWRTGRTISAARPVLLALAALTFTNLLLHTWTDEVVALSFWILAGACLGVAKIPKSKI